MRGNGGHYETRGQWDAPGRHPGQRAPQSSVEQYIAKLGDLEGGRADKKARIFQLREKVIKGRLGMEKISVHMEEVLARARSESEGTCAQINQLFSDLKLQLAAKEAEIVSTMQSRYAGLSDELSSTISSLKTMSQKSEDIAAMTADVITGTDEAANSVLDHSSQQLEQQLGQLITSQDLKVSQTAEQVLRSQEQQSTIFKIDKLRDSMAQISKQCDALYSLVSLDPAIRRRDVEAASRRSGSSVPDDRLTGIQNRIQQHVESGRSYGSQPLSSQTAHQFPTQQQQQRRLDPQEHTPYASSTPHEPTHNPSEQRAPQSHNDPVLTDTPHKFQFARSVQSQDLTLVTHMHINKYDSPFTNGIIHWMGATLARQQKGSRATFINPGAPVNSGSNPLIRLSTANAVVDGRLESLTGGKHFEGDFFESDNDPAAWVCLDFGEFYRVLPDHYTLGYYVNGDDHIPCSWELQGSSDLVRWTALHRQMDSSSLIPKPHVASWPIAPPGSIAQMDEDESNFVHAQAKARRNVQPSPIVDAGPYRYIRIVQKGPTSSGSFFLVLSCVEFYGKLFTVATASDEGVGGVTLDSNIGRSRPLVVDTQAANGRNFHDSGRLEQHHLESRPSGPVFESKPSNSTAPRDISNRYGFQDEPSRDSSRQGRAEHSPLQQFQDYPETSRSENELFGYQNLQSYVAPPIPPKMKDLQRDDHK